MAYSESDTRVKLIDPALTGSGWSEGKIVREYYFTEGRKLIGGKRGKRHFVDYLLVHNNANLAIVEAKAEDKDPLDGLQQVIEYASKLRIEWVYTTNGHKIYEHSMRDGKGEYVSAFASPEELFGRIYGGVGAKTKEVISQGYYLGAKKPRYYQQIAISKAVEAIAGGKDRVLLTLATGTGKTYIAFQIIYRLFEAKWSKDGANRRPRVLFLADRNILIDQAYNEFNPIEKECVKVNGVEIRKRNGKVPTNANVFFAIYQAISERRSDEADSENDFSGYFEQYDPEFFDLIVIDECHRGAANDESSWRKVLDRFKSAAHLGLTATPKRDDNGDTYAYFGDPVYEYSLRDGINDGFLTPYKVRRIRTNIDEYVYNPDDIIEGELENGVAKLEDFETKVVIPRRTELIAKTIVENIAPHDKTIVFCVNQSHAAQMKAAIDKFKSVRDNAYCVRVTSDEGAIGRKYLEDFQNNDKTIPTILTSSQMLTTGVDAKNVRNVVLVRSIKSMTEFKQIIGRGTRTYEGKDFFTILDFTGATNLFHDAKWDGESEPVEPSEPQEPKPSEPKEPKDGDKKDKKEKTYIDIRGKKLRVIDIETSYVGAEGKPLRTAEYLEYLVGVLGGYYDDEAKLRAIWSDPKNRRELLNKLRELNIDEEQLNELKDIFEAPNSDIYDILAHISFNLEIKTRSERALSAMHGDFVERYHDQKAKAFLEFILRRYERDGYKELDEDKLSSLIELSLTDKEELKATFGGAMRIKEAYHGLQKEIYR